MKLLNEDSPRWERGDEGQFFHWRTNGTLILIRPSIFHAERWTVVDNADPYIEERNLTKTEAFNLGNQLIELGRDFRK